MCHTKLPEGDDASDRHSVLDAAVIIFIFGLEVCAVRFWLPSARKRGFNYFSRRADQTPIQSRNGELVTGFRDHVLGVAVAFRIRCLQQLIGSSIRWNTL